MMHIVFLLLLIILFTLGYLLHKQAQTFLALIGDTTDNRQFLTAFARCFFFSVLIGCLLLFWLTPLTLTCFFFAACSLTAAFSFGLAKRMS